MKQSGNGAQALNAEDDPPEDGPTTEKSRKYGRARRLAASLDALGPLRCWHGKCYDSLFVWLA